MEGRLLVMAIVIFLMIIVLDASTLSGPEQVKSRTGEAVQITCKYHQFYRSYIKYWCKGYYWNHCTVMIRSDQPSQSNCNILISDDKDRGVFTITMRNTKEEDSGWYWCGIERVSRHVGFSVRLVFTEGHISKTTVSETSTGAVKMQTSPLITSRETSEPITSAPATTDLLTSVSFSGPANNATRIGGHIEVVVMRTWTVLRWVLFAGLCMTLLVFHQIMKL
ncbi:hypothetical protein MATL_G00180880 [Megalops atlanticus]|uniref:Ig-like domain-containing protein n=1 Tax=Megalops atlanticus TaxID=7932 RepID=A0A9D3PPQ0_MEGAT|nr:hypothetical protein MATL_G00180880 [Megalops atlanticus]